MEEFLCEVFDGSIPQYLVEYLCRDCGVTTVDDLETLWTCKDEWRDLGKPFLSLHKARIANYFEKRQVHGN